MKITGSIMSLPSIGYIVYDENDMMLIVCDKPTVNINVVVDYEASALI